MATAACDHVLTGSLTELCDLARALQTDSIKNCISIEVTCLALALSVKSHSLAIIHVSLPSSGVIITIL